MTNQQDQTPFAWRWNDPSHLDAHRAEFSRPIESILSELHPLVAVMRPHPEEIERSSEPIMLHADWELSSVAGTSGLRVVPADGSESFWAYRHGRAIPSHLCHGERVQTRRVCLWGWWEQAAFLIHTLYPGTVAPREIHDPALALEDIPAALEFWSTHAIITSEGEYHNEAAPDQT